MPTATFDAFDGIVQALNVNPWSNWETVTVGPTTANVGIKKVEPKIPKPKKIYQRGKATIVEWQDGDKTVVVKEDNCEESLYHAFCAAFAKKMFKSTGNVMKLIDKADEKKINEKKAKLAAIAEQEAAKMKKEQEDAAFKEAVAKRVYQMKVEDAAAKALYSRKLDQVIEDIMKTLTTDGSDKGEA